MNHTTNPFPQQMKNAQGHSIVADKIVPDTDATWLKSSGKKEKLATVLSPKRQPPCPSTPARYILKPFAVFYVR